MNSQSISQVEAKPIGYHFTKRDGAWCVTGPNGNEHRLTYVTKADGTIAKVTLGAIIRPGWLPVYAIAKPGEKPPARPDRPHTRRMRIP